MSKLHVMRNISTSVLLAACLTVGMPGQPLFAGEETELVTENAENTENAETAQQSPVTYDYEELTVGATTPFNGNFFTGLWGNMTSDADVRSLIHGYSLVKWDHKLDMFDLDPSVVSGSVVTESPEGDRTYTLTIYDDLAYCDGTPITAADYAFSLLLEISPEMAQIGANTKKAEYIKGYDAYMKGETSSLAGIRILNDLTFSVTIDHAYLPFFYEQALLDITPYPISVIAPGCKAVDDGSGICIVNEDETVKEPVFTADLLKETILDGESGYLSHPAVTSGPYRLTSFDGTTAAFEINSRYKGNADGVKPSIRRLIYTRAENASMITELSKGSYGLLNKCTNQEALAQGVKLVSDKESGFAMSSYPRTGLAYISFCCEKAAVGSEAVRQAIAMCLDKDQLVSDYVGNFGLRADGYYGLGQWMYMAANGTLPYPGEEPAQGDADAQAKYEADLEAWDSLSLEDVKVYDLDVDAAADLLAGDGWVLNRDGGDFDPAKDDVRCKEIDGKLTALELTLIYPEGNAIGESLEANFTEHLKEAGILLTATAVPMEELTKMYYSESERSCDMIYVATNFDVDFDPSQTFRARGTDEGEGADGAGAEETSIDVNNVTGINDQQLYDLAVAMRRTEPGKVLEYCEKWVQFQKRFAQVLPMIPVYSNVYFDFYPNVLHNYRIEEFVSWGQAVVEAYLSDAADEAEEMTEEAVVFE